jgi:hypothetical protein
MATSISTPIYTSLTDVTNFPPWWMHRIGLAKPSDVLYNVA